MATKTYIYKPATINGQPANGATRTIVRDAATGAMISDTGYKTSSGTVVAGTPYQAPPKAGESRKYEPNLNVTVDQTGRIVGKGNLTAGYPTANVGGIANDRDYSNRVATAKPIQTFSSGKYNPNTGEFIDNQGRGYSTMDPAKLNAQISAGPTIKSSLNTSSVSKAPTASIVAVVATKTVIDKNSSISDVIKAGNEAAAAAVKARDSGAFNNIKTAEPTGYDFGTMKTGGGLLQGIFGEDKPIAVDRKTGQKYFIVETGDTQGFGAGAIGFNTAEKEKISQKIYGVPFERDGGLFANTGYETYTKKGGLIELGTTRTIDKEEEALVARLEQNRGVNKASQQFTFGLALGGGGKVINTGTQAATQTLGPVVAKTGVLNAIKPYLISAGLYGFGTQAPTIAEQVALQTNKEQLKGVDVGTEKFNKVIGATFTKTNQEYFGGTNYNVDEQGNIIKEDTVKGKAGALQKFVTGAFPALKANPLDIYDDDFRKNVQTEYKKVYGKELTEAQTDAVVNTYLYSSGAGQAVGQIAEEVASEYAFRNLAKATLPGQMKNVQMGTTKGGLRLGGLLAVEAAPFGLLEGATGEITQSNFEKRDQDPTRIATAGLAGALTSSTFNFVGGGLTGRFGNKGGKVTQFLGWAVDPPGEFIGDKAVDLATRGGLNVRLPGVTTPSVSTGGINTTTTTKTNTNTNAKNNTTLTKGEKDAVNKAQNQFSNWLNKGIITIEPSVGVNNSISSDTQNKGGTNNNVNNNTNNDNTTNNNNTDNTSTTNNTDIFNEENTNNETNTEVNVDIFNDSTTTTTSVNVPIVTPAGGTGFPFFFPFAGAGSNRRGRSKGLIYYNELEKAQGFYEGLQYGGKLPTKKKRGVKK